MIKYSPDAGQLYEICSNDSQGLIAMAGLSYLDARFKPSPYPVIYMRGLDNEKRDETAKARLFKIAGSEVEEELRSSPKAIVLDPRESQIMINAARIIIGNPTLQRTISLRNQVYNYRGSTRRTGYPYLGSELPSHLHGQLTMAQAWGATLHGLGNADRALGIAQHIVDISDELSPDDYFKLALQRNVDSRSGLVNL